MEHVPTSAPCPSGPPSFSLRYYDEDWEEVAELTVTDALPLEASCAVDRWIQYLVDHANGEQPTLRYLGVVSFIQVEVHYGRR